MHTGRYMDHKKGTATFSPRFPPKKPKGPVRVRSQYGYSALLVSVPVRPRTCLYPYGKSATGTLGYGALRVRGICLGSVPLCPLGSIRGPVANVQSEVDEAAGRSVYGPKGLPRMMEEAKQQCLDDFRLASGLVPEGRGKVDVLRAAEKLIINTLVQESRKHLFVRKFEMFAMVEKATSKARDMLTKHVGKPGATSDGGQTYTAADGKSGGGRGQGGSSQSKGKGGIKKCYACNQYGHMSYDCPTKQQAFGLGAPAPFPASPPFTQQQSLPQYRQPAGQQAGGSGKKDQ